MRLSPDQLIYWQHGFLKLNATIVFTWALMLVLAVGSKLITRRLSVDLQRQQNLGSGRTSNYWATKTQAGATTSVVGIVNTQTITLSTNSWDVNYYKVSQTDVPSDSNILPLFNLYYDIDTGTKFKPYVGAGAGLSITKVKRTNSTNANCDHTINTYIDPFSHNQVQTSLGNTCSSTTTTLPQQNYNSAAIQSVTNYGFAGALMTGLGYEIRPGITLDTGYRFLWSTNGPTTSAPSFASDGSPQPDTRTRLGDRFDHQILAGVRFDLQ